MTYGTEFLTTEREAELLASIIVNLPDNSDGYNAADGILCDLIEMGLTGMDAGPNTLQHWKTLGITEDVDALRKDLIAFYLSHDVT